MEMAVVIFIMEKLAVVWELAASKLTLKPCIVVSARGIMSYHSELVCTGFEKKYWLE